jgi:Zn-dependent peptidase ImmA (M78 family)
VNRQQLTNIAKEFWNLAGRVDKWPCDIERAVTLLTPLNIITLSELNFHRITEWFNSRNISFEIEYTERILHGFISVHKNFGFIFLNGSDTENERRYTVAHEVSHYLVDYRIPRNKAIDTYGEKIIEVLDGYREPTIDERVQSVLGAISIKPYTHVLEVSAGGRFERYGNWLIEKDADALALELLAPYKIVQKDFSKHIKKDLEFEESKRILVKILRDKYDLPESISAEYASIIAAGFINSKTIIDRLGLRKK